MINFCILYLFQELSYFADMIQKKDTILLKELRTTGIDTKENKIIFANIGVPPTSPTDFDSNNIVSVRYFLRVCFLFIRLLHYFEWISEI